MVQEDTDNNGSYLPTWFYYTRPNIFTRCTVDIEIEIFDSIIRRRHKQAFIGCFGLCHVVDRNTRLSSDQYQTVRKCGWERPPTIRCAHTGQPKYKVGIAVIVVSFAQISVSLDLPKLGLTHEDRIIKNMRASRWQKRFQSVRNCRCQLHGWGNT